MNMTTASKQASSHGLCMDYPARCINPQLPILDAHCEPGCLRQDVLADQGGRTCEIAYCGVSEQLELNGIPDGSIDTAEVYTCLQARILKVQGPTIADAFLVELLLRQA